MRMDDLLKHQFLQDCLVESSARATALPGKPLSESDWAEVVVLAERHGVAPLLYERLTTGACPSAVPDRVRQSLREAFLMNGAKNALLYKELAQVLRALRQANIPVIVLKGAHLAASVFGHIAVRTMNDIDLLVGMNDLEKSASRLGDLGYFAEIKVLDIAAWCETCRHWPRLFRPPPAPGLEIHWTLTLPSQFPHITTAGFWERSRPTTIAGVETRVLSPEDLLLYLCLHTAAEGVGPFRLGLRPLCDIAAVVHCYQEEITWHQVQSRAIEWQADRCAYLGLWLAKELLVAGIPDSVLKSLRPQDFDEHWAALAVNQVVLRLSPEAEVASGPLKVLITRCSSEPRRGKLGVLLKALFPSRDYMANYMAARHGVSLNSVRNYSCYLTRAVDLFGRGARAAWHWGLHRREMVADLQRFRQQTRLWNWLAGANSDRQSAGR
jgi:Uncharacterised nucleotidyltransferase